jgi:hypothetical protein
MLEWQDHAQRRVLVEAEPAARKHAVFNEVGLQKSLPTPRFEERDQSDLPDRPRQRRPGQFEELPLLVLVLAEEAEFDEVLGASELRRLPQGSAGFASGIFLSDSL